MSGKNKYTIKDIARMSGFSVRTVSRVINNKPHVKDETRQKIHKILEETGFETNVFAKNLRKRAMKNIMVVIEKQKDIYPGQWYTNILQKVINEALLKGYNIFMKEYVPDQLREEAEGFRLLKSGFVDGVIIFNIRKNDEKIKLLKEINMPFVTIGKVEEYSDIPYVTSDNWQGAFEATEYLLNQNREKIVFMVGSKDYTINKERIDGFKAALLKYQVPFRNDMLYTDIRSFYDTYHLCKKIITENKLPDAFFISGDEKSFGALKALHDYNVRIPRDVAVVGFDNIPLSRFTVPALTTVEQPVDLIVQETLKMLFNLLEDKDEQQERQVIIPTKLIIRDSTGGS